MLDAVLKIGGSLGRGSGLGTLCHEIRCLGKSFRLLIVPGGGVFADQVRAAYHQFSLPETTAHTMALCAMDQYGRVLHHLIAGSCLTEDLVHAVEAASSGNVSILLPSTVVLHQSNLPHSWDVTSDSIAVWITERTNCKRLVLIKDVDGFLEGFKDDGRGGRLLAEMKVRELQGHNGCVDAYLPSLLESVDIETWIVNGTRPERLKELLEKGYTAGTRICRK